MLPQDTAREAPPQPTFTCLVCGSTQIRDRHDRKWCRPCKALGLRAYKAEQRRASGVPELGSRIKCKHCGRDAEKVHRRQRYCAPCSALGEAGKLPDAIVWNRDYQRRYQRERRQQSAAATINSRMAAGIKNSIRSLKAGRSWEALVGYTILGLMRHLERQFPKGMTWENRGLWHIDHVVPLKSFTFTSPDDAEFKAAWALTNLQPLWGADNVRKGGRRITLL